MFRKLEKVDFLLLAKIGLAFFGLVMAGAAALPNQQETIKFIAAAALALWGFAIMAEMTLAGMHRENKQTLDKLDLRLQSLEPKIDEAPERFVRQLGLYCPTEKLIQIRDWLGHGPSVNHELDDTVDDLIAKYARDGARALGDTGHSTQIDMPVMLTEAQGDPQDLEDLTRVACSLAMQHLSDLDHAMNFHYVGAVLGGNQLLAMQVAQVLKRPLILINTDPAVSSGNRVIGACEPGHTVLLVHDVIFTGDRIVRAVDALRQRHLEVRHTIAVLRRTDRGSRPTEALARRGVTLVAAREMCADEVRALRARRNP